MPKDIIESNGEVNNLRVVLGMTTHNEIEYGPHIWVQLDDLLEMDHDDIVILDDGSTDGTWDVIREYANKDNRIHPYRNEKNSVVSKGENRWFTLWKRVSEYKPTWVNIRACDQLYSKELKKNFRKIVGKFDKRKVDMVTIPLAHLWRSMYWYRLDSEWGRHVRGHLKKQLIRYKDWSFKGNFKQAVFHQGGHLPNNMHIGKILPINEGVKKTKTGEFLYTVLHIGHTTHEKKVAKFRWTMRAADEGQTMLLPTSADMPPVLDWLKYNGIKGFHEFKIELKKAPQEWFEEKIPEDLEPPLIESFYEVIKEYNEVRAKEYQKLYKKFFGDTGKLSKPELKSRVKVELDVIDKTPEFVNHPPPVEKKPKQIAFVKT